ncbi:TPA: hypothetical protein GJ770_04255 [Legionella pneumophila]|nr:hypothetical protein [Legionella pneumophila]
MRKYSSILSIFSFILSQFIFLAIFDALDLKAVLDTAPYIVRYGRGIEEEFNSVTTYIGFLSLLYSVLIAYTVNSFVRNGSINKLEKLKIKYCFIFSLVLIPAYFAENFIFEEINSQSLYNIFSLAILGMVIISGYMLYRVYSFKKAKLMGFKLFVMTCIHGTCIEKHYFEAKTKKDVIHLAENNKYLFSVYENAYLDTIRLAPGIFSLKLSKFMQYKNRLIY